MENTPHATHEVTNTEQTSVEPQLSVPPLSVTDPQFKSKSLIAIVTVSVLLVVVGISGYILGQRKSQSTLQVPTTPTPATQLGQQIQTSPIQSNSPSSPQPDTAHNWPQYTFNLTDTHFVLQSPDGKPKTELSNLNEYKQGGVFVMGAMDNKLFTVNDLKMCEKSISDSKTICIVPGQNWNQAEDKQDILIDGNHALSVYLFEPKSNAVLHVIQFTQGFPIQISTAVDGVGREDNFKQILNSFKFVE